MQEEKGSESANCVLFANELPEKVEKKYLDVLIYSAILRNNKWDSVSNYATS